MTNIRRRIRLSCCVACVTRAFFHHFAKQRDVPQPQWRSCRKPATLPLV